MIYIILIILGLIAVYYLIDFIFLGGAMLVFRTKDKIKDNINDIRLTNIEAKETAKYKTNLNITPEVRSCVEKIKNETVIVKFKEFTVSQFENWLTNINSDNYKNKVFSNRTDLSICLKQKFFISITEAGIRINEPINGWIEDAGRHRYKILFIEQGVLPVKSHIKLEAIAYCLYTSIMNYYKDISATSTFKFKSIKRTVDSRSISSDTIRDLNLHEIGDKIKYVEFELIFEGTIKNTNKYISL